MGGSRGRLIDCGERKRAIMLVSQSCKAGARKHKACELLGLSVRTLERCEKDNGTDDKRKITPRIPANKLTQEQRDMVLKTANSVTYRNLPPCKIVPLLADEGCYIPK